MPLFLAILLLGYPLLEIAVFVMVGSEIGVLPTIGLIILSAVAGAVLMRWQGFGAMQRIRREVERGNAPGRELAHGAMIMLAGILLLIPGFISDVFGILLFVPAVREFAWRILSHRVTVMTRFSGSMDGFRTRGGRDGGPTIDLDEDEYSQSPNQDSPWRRRELD